LQGEFITHAHLMKDDMRSQPFNNLLSRELEKDLVNLKRQSSPPLPYNYNNPDD